MGGVCLPDLSLILCQIRLFPGSTLVIALAAALLLCRPWEGAVFKPKHWGHQQVGTAKQREVWKTIHLESNRPASSWLCKLQGVCAFNPCLLGVDGGAASAGSTVTESEVKVLVTQSCPTLCDPMDCSFPGSSVHGILQARILEWIAFLFSRVSRVKSREPAALGALQELMNVSVVSCLGWEHSFSKS